MKTEWLRACSFGFGFLMCLSLLLGFGRLGLGEAKLFQKFDFASDELDISEGFEALNELLKGPAVRGVDRGDMAIHNGRVEADDEVILADVESIGTEVDGVIVFFGTDGSGQYSKVTVDLKRPAISLVVLWPRDIVTLIAHKVADFTGVPVRRVRLSGGGNHEHANNAQLIRLEIERDILREIAKLHLEIDGTTKGSEKRIEVLAEFSATGSAPPAAFKCVDPISLFGTCAICSESQPCLQQGEQCIVQPANCGI